MQAPAEYLWSCKACIVSKTVYIICSRVGVRFSCFENSLHYLASCRGGYPIV
uniref:Uncharacterized protein n=1 Tax=Helianthus annuus TaxID=4232 RepID=A0A251UQ19_HELAN